MSILAAFTFVVVAMEYWEKIVVLRLNDRSQTALSINDTKDAARVLLKGWPATKGKSYRRAILSCSAALHGRAPQDAAQWAFVVAAMEAAITFELIDRFDIEIAAVCRELLAEEMPQEPSAPAVERDGPMPPFWWPKPQASAPSAR